MEYNSELSKKIVEFINSVTPKGTAVLINDSHTLSVHLTCPGKDYDMGYHCWLKPGHSGKCWTRIKGVEFTPNNKKITEDN